MRDELFDRQERVRDFIFDDDVATVFDDMLERSVPFYAEVQRMVVELATHYLHAGGVVYDIGCSTGTTLAGIAAAVPPEREVRFVGFEPSPAMRERAAAKLAGVAGPGRVEIQPDRIEEVDRLPGARVVTMLYTLQFVRPVHRAAVLRMIHDSLCDGACLIVAEKILATDGDLRRLYIDLYHEHKRRQGYTSTEIVRKREALENVLVPFTASENRMLLREAGFVVVEPFFQWYNFAAYVAVKR